MLGLKAEKSHLASQRLQLEFLSGNGTLNVLRDIPWITLEVTLCQVIGLASSVLSMVVAPEEEFCFNLPEDTGTFCVQSRCSATTPP